MRATPTLDVGWTMGFPPQTAIDESLYNTLIENDVICQATFKFNHQPSFETNIVSLTRLLLSSHGEYNETYHHANVQFIVINEEDVV